MSTNKKGTNPASVNPLIETLDVMALKNKTGNLYESIAVLARRSNQIAVNTKEELQKRLDDFSQHTDTMEEVQENKEQIEISRIYERMANAPLQALTEFKENRIFHRINKPQP
ncbi:MAG: DNA-directed RNA polymerase subunit omega [Chitinophagia bacterium]|nr:DNA-directed RNA polymerase subunit omega [Chitinophagia bacterium]